MSVELHIYHCQLCFIPSQCQLSLKASRQEKFNTSQNDGIAESNPTTCPIVSCTNIRCSFRMHRCKLEDHLTICVYSLVPCINSEYGCRKVLPYIQMGPHLEHCEASLVMCYGKFARKLAGQSDLEKENYPKYFEQMLEGQSGTQDPDVFTDLLLEHWKTVLKNADEVVIGSGSETSGEPSDETDEEVRDEPSNDVAISDEPEWRQSSLPERIGKCVTCTKLGITCMYDIERMNKKPFWIEARKHFNDKTSSGRGSQTLKLLKPDLLNGSGFWVFGSFLFIFKEKSPFADVDFPCRVMRRDEYATHWYLHHDLLLQLQPNRCPNRFGSSEGDVCTYSCPSIDNPEYEMKYQTETSAITFSPQKFKIDSAQNGQEDGLTQDLKEEVSSFLKLPIEVVFGIMQYLDSLSLTSLSQVSKHIRWLVISYCDEYERAMAIRDWTKSSKNDRLQFGMHKWNASAPRYTLSRECFNPQSVAKYSREFREMRASSSDQTFYESQFFYVNPQLCSMVKINPNASSSLISHLSQCSCYERKSTEEILRYNLDCLPAMSEKSNVSLLTDCAN